MRLWDCGLALLLCVVPLLPQSLATGKLRVPAPNPKRTKSVALGQIVGATAAEVTRAGDESKLRARPGDLLFQGDRLTTGGQPATFVYCPPGAARLRATLASNAQVQFDPDILKLVAGQFVESRTAEFCELPSVDLNPETAAKGIVESKPSNAPPPDTSRLSQSDQLTLSRITAALSKDANDLVAITTRAVLLARNGLLSNAMEEYRKLAASRQDLPWAKELVHETDAVPLPKAAASSAVFAVIIGVSRYGRPSDVPDLHFADRDAQSFYSYLRSPRGGSIPPENIRLLLNEQATSASIKNYIGQFNGKPRSKLIVFLSGHGAVSNGQGYLITYRSDPANLKDSAYPMRALTELMYGSPGRVELYVDACRSGHIGSITERNAINRYLKADTGTVLGILASHEGEKSWEYKDLGDGHGAFTYFLLRALNSPEKYESGKLTVYDLTQYVKEKVRFVTRTKQNPQDETTSLDVNEPVAFAKEKGIGVEKWDGKPIPPEILGTEKGKLLFDAEEPAPPAPGLSQDQEVETLIALENRGQAILLRYLKGDEIAQERSDFQSGLDVYTQALRIEPDSVYLASRQKFFEGRLAIADGDFAKARDSLETAIRLDPASPSAYNALGIAYLEEAAYPEAVAAFDDAIWRAPYWPYPRHNLALAYAQQGEYERAIQTYRVAMKVAPHSSYLPYNLGLLFERMNRFEDARQSFQTARETARLRAEQAASEAKPQPQNTSYRFEAERLGGQRVPPVAALSLLNGTDGRTKEELRFYQEAVELLKQYPNPGQLAIVRHNHAVILAKTRRGFTEAKSLWQANIEEFQYVPSRISFADALLAQHPIPDRDGAIDQYRQAVAADPSNVGPQLRLAELLQQSGKQQEALPLLKQASQIAKESVLVWETLGDLETKLHDDASKATYQRAAFLARDPKTRERLRRKADGLP